MCSKLVSLTCSRLFGSRISHAVPCTANFPAWALPGPQHHDVGAGPWFPCCMHKLCGPIRCQNFARCLRKLVRYPAFEQHVFQIDLCCSVAPILVLIIAMWYKKHEQGRRVSWFYVCNSLTQIFGGCVAYGVSFASTGFATWRIFYIAIGALTMVVGALVAAFLPDSPVKARRFTDAEKVAALMRVKDNQRLVISLQRTNCFN